MGWFSEDELTNIQLVEYFVSANIWRLLTGACVFVALYCYTSSETPQQARPVCLKMADKQATKTADKQATNMAVHRKASALVSTTLEPDKEQPQPHQQHGVKMVFNGPVHVVMPANLGKVFDEWDFEHQECRSDLF